MILHVTLLYTSLQVDGRRLEVKGSKSIAIWFWGQYLKVEVVDGHRCRWWEGALKACDSKMADVCLMQPSAQTTTRWSQQLFKNSTVLFKSPNKWSDISNTHCRLCAAFKRKQTFVALLDIFTASAKQLSCTPNDDRLLTELPEIKRHEDAKALKHWPVSSTILCWV